MTDDQPTPVSPDEPPEYDPLDHLRDAFAEDPQGSWEADDENDADDIEEGREKYEQFLNRTNFRRRFPIFDQMDRITGQFDTGKVIPNPLASVDLTRILPEPLPTSLWQSHPGIARILPAMNSFASAVDSYNKPVIENLPRIADILHRYWAPAIDQIIPNWLSSITLPNLAQHLLAVIEQRVIPDNLAELGLTVHDLEDVAETLDDGIPLYWVPRARIARRLIAATSTQQRRKIIGDEIPAITDDCLDALELVSNSKYLYEADRLREASELVLTHPAAAQALAMAVLDSLMFQVKPKSEVVLKQVISEKGRSKDGHEKAARVALQDVLGHRGVLALAPVRPMYNQSRTDDPPGDIPRSLNRHSTLHRVHPYQYSRRNATIALMTASSVLVYMSRWLDTEINRATR